MDAGRGQLAAIAMGSNLGDRAGHLTRAIIELAALPKSRLVRRSGIIQTAPQPIHVDPGSPHTPDPSLGGPYLNAVVLLRTTLEPETLLEALVGIERSMGRVRDPALQAAPRTIDLDLLVYADRVLSSAALTLPHPRLHLREFVLAPLDEVAPDLLVPVHNRTVRQLLDELRAGSRALERESGRGNGGLSHDRAHQAKT